MAFSDLGLDERILKAIQEIGYTEPTPIQAAAIPPILAGQDIVGIAQTGTGKTAAFTLPLLTRIAGAPTPRQGISALILAPTRELVVQIDENVRAYAKHLPVRIALVYGGVGERPQIQALRGAADIVVATPGRLIDLMSRRHGDFSQLKYLVLDEADRMLDMGFLPSMRRILTLIPRQRQTLLFSATLSRDIEGLIHDFQKSPKIVQIGRRSNPAETVTQLVYEVPRHLKTALMIHLLKDPKLDMVLAFSRTKHAADRLARQLEDNGIRTATLHSNRSQGQRLRALKDFKDGLVRVLVATDIASRGIDVDGISHVVNYDFPMHAEDYVHRIGRTGRAKAVGDAISFVTPDDQTHLRSAERFIGRGVVRKRAEGFDYASRSGDTGGGGARSDSRPDRSRQGSPGGSRPPAGADRRPHPAPRPGESAPRHPAPPRAHDGPAPFRAPDRGPRQDAPRPYGGRPSGPRAGVGERPYRGPAPSGSRPPERGFDRAREASSGESGAGDAGVRSPGRVRFGGSARPAPRPAAPRPPSPRPGGWSPKPKFRR